MFDVGTSVESDSGDDDDLVAAADLVTATAVGVEVAASRAFGSGELPRAADGSAGFFTAALLVGDDATSPALALRDEAAVLAVGRRDGDDARATSAADGRSSADCNTQPSREMRTQPVGASPVRTTTDVPASSDATLRADVAPRDRTTALRLPTRVDEARRSGERRVRSTNPSIDTLA
jgi:hypothetical protein